MPAHKGQLTRVPLPNNRRSSPQPAGVGGESTKPAAMSAVRTMRDTLRTAAGHAVYEMRKAVLESMFRTFSGLLSILLDGARQRSVSEPRPLGNGDSNSTLYVNSENALARSGIGGDVRGFSFRRREKIAAARRIPQPFETLSGRSVPTARLRG